MVPDILVKLRSVVFVGINVLEWVGILCIASLAFFAVNGGWKSLMKGMDDRRMSRRKKISNPDKATMKRLPHGSGDETVLVVDDDPAVLRSHVRLVSRLGYNVQRALGGQEAIEYVRGKHADLIVLDLLMPGMDGIETFRSIKNINPYQKAIVLSGFAGPAMVTSIKNLGVNTYLVKPAEVGILAKAIRDEIDRP